MHRKLNARVVALEELSGEERAKWQQLCLSVPAARNPFLSPVFAECVAAVRPRVRVGVIYQDAAPVGFFPFQFKTKLHEALGIAELVGGYMAGYGGLVAAPGLQVQGPELALMCGLSYVWIPFLEESQTGYGLQVDEGKVGHLIRLDHGGPAYWEQIKSRDKKFVAEMLRRERQLITKYGPLRFCFAEQVWDQSLQDLMKWKSAQYARTHQPNLFGAAWRRSLLLRLAEKRDPACTGILSTLHAGSTWVASHFGLRHTSTLCYYFPVYNQELSRYAPGHLLLKNIIDHAGPLGLRLIDRGAGDTQAKQDFSNEQHIICKAAWFRPGLRSWVYRCVRGVKWRLLEAEERLKEATRI